jgi:hypothetical protein
MQNGKTVATKPESRLIATAIAVSYAVAFTLLPAIPQHSDNATKQTVTEKLPPIISRQTEQTMGLITSDPRIAEMWYFNLVMTTEAGATKLATFCRARGLETYVARTGPRVNDTRLYRVIALPGSIERNDGKMAETLSKIHAIGREWTDTPDGRGNDLRDAYPSLKKNPSTD